ncbi:Chaperone protein DnaJ [Cytospora mali]|uniref:Chaperone protein DnaJ n=1 Tax=Cytospora mali TaxID=578113 RepID=A0A194VWY0_CYTMA|nr:Chaperone protein DnaJ [Valsa mali]
MVKLDFNQDYYADLEVGPSAGIEDIRRSYRKLALKYHPDRNPGSEIQAGQRFQIIQAAYEVLTNAEQKQRYDNSRRTRYGGASGVRGNPYQDISKNYPTPPRPPGFPTRTAPKRAPPTSAADTYAKFAKDVPASSPRNNRKPAEPTFTWQAWEQMKSGAKGKTTSSQATGSGTSAKASTAPKPTPSTAPPPVPPRSPQKQAKGSFGSRVNRGYTPQSPIGDEPPVASNNYFTTRTHTNLFSETSTAAQARPQDPPNPDPTADPAPTADPDPTTEAHDSTYVDTRKRTPYRTPGGEKLDPFQGANINRSRSTRESTTGPYHDEDDDSPTTSSRQRSASDPDDPELGPKAKQGGKAASTGGNDTGAAPNGSKPTSESQNRDPQGSPDVGGHSTMPNTPPEANASGGAGLNDRDNSKFFDFQYADHSFTPDPHRFTRNSADNINTRFVADESDATNWQFNAGSPVSEASRPAMPRSKSGSRIGRKSPFHAQAPQAPPAEPTSGSVPPQNSSFNPEEWSEKIGPQIFQTPGQTPKGNTIRPIRNPSKKPKPVRMTAGTAGMVESDENSSGQEDIPQKPPTPADANDLDGISSPNAMDIDDPLEANGVRNIHVEPSRPEWRAGDVKGIKADAAPAAGSQTGTVPPVGGSEDSEEFRATFSDLRNVEPFAQPSTGLESFGDLKSNLPFTSGAAGEVPIPKSPKKPVKLDLPEAPKPPNAPPPIAVQGLKPSAASWKKYVDDFYKYLTEWHAYSTKFSDHFHARHVEVQKKLTNPGWVESRDGAGIQEYLRWSEEDRQVRAKWTEASDGHELHVRVFVAHRDRMMK